MIDFRSDTVTKPCKAMRDAMAKAEVGDDVYGDDPTVNQLEIRVAELTGHQAAMLVPSGTQSNLIGLLTHCGRGDEYIVGQDYHTYFYESGGAACLGGIQPQPILVEDDGSLDLAMVEKRIKPNDVHFAKTRLLSLENTHSGKVLANSYLNDAIGLAKQHQLAVHLDGARVFNAAVAQKMSVNQITQKFDSVSVCFSKGLGAPIGSMLCGTEEFINKARRWRKMVGGGMRQAGIFAAAIDYALNNNLEKLALDHQHAMHLQTELQNIDELVVEQSNTNMLYIEFRNDAIAQKAVLDLKHKNILVTAGKRMRLVTHLDITESDITLFIDELKKTLTTSQ
jgi:threonine aldolase